MAFANHCPLARQAACARRVAPPRLALSNQPGVQPASSGRSRRQVIVLARGSGGVMDKPSVLPGNEKSTNTVSRKPPIYKVMLHNDNYNRREYVVKVLMKVVDTITVDDAVNVMQEAHVSGVALVVACAQDQAEVYCEGLRLNGLVASLEPGC